MITAGTGRKKRVSVHADWRAGMQAPMLYSTLRWSAACGGPVHAIARCA